MPTKSERTRQKILERALASFRRRGFEKTTMRDVAEAAGVALGAAYYYFPSKDAIVLAYYQETQARHGELARAAMKKAGEDLTARVRAVFHTKLDLLAKDRKLLGTILRSVGDPDDPLSLFGASTRDVRDDSIRLFEEAVAPFTPEGGELRALLARALWSLHMGVLLYFMHDRSPGQQKTRRLVDESVGLASELVAFAPLLEPFTARVTAILRDADLT